MSKKSCCESCEYCDGRILAKIFDSAGNERIWWDCRNLNVTGKNIGKRIRCSEYIKNENTAMEMEIKEVCGNGD